MSPIPEFLCLPTNPESLILVDNTVVRFHHEMTYEIRGVDLARSILTLVGYFLSVCGASTILVSYVILPQRRHIRHALIINLAVAGELSLTLFSDS